MNTKSNLHKSFATDKGLETEGIVVDLGEVKIKLRRFGGANSQKLKAAHAKYIKPYANLIKYGSMPEEKHREAEIKAFTEVSIVGWEGVKDDQGNEVPFSIEIAASYLIELPDLFAELWARANASESFRPDVGNS